MTVETGNKIIEAKPLSTETELEIELGKKLIYDSLNSVNDYAKSMIGFNGALVGIYSGSLKLLPQESIQNVDSAMLFLPVIFFVFSAVMFTMAYFPRMKRVSIDRPSSILITYRELVDEKMNLSKIGTIIFIIYIIILSYMFVFIIK